MRKFQQSCIGFFLLILTCIEVKMIDVGGSCKTPGRGGVRVGVVGSATQEAASRLRFALPAEVLQEPHTLIPS